MAAGERRQTASGHLWLVALVMPALPFAAIGLFSWTGWGVWLWLGPIVILGVVPVIDLVAGPRPVQSA